MKRLPLLAVSRLTSLKVFELSQPNNNNYKLKVSKIRDETFDSSFGGAKNPRRSRRPRNHRAGGRQTVKGALDAEALYSQRFVDVFILTRSAVRDRQDDDEYGL